VLLHWEALWEVERERRRYGERVGGDKMLEDKFPDIQYKNLQK